MNAANLIGVKLGNYRLERLLGRGRMGVVYLARDEALLRPTAVKILSWLLPEHHGLDPEAWFLAEARNVARINHPHVIQIYGVAKHGQHCYIAMEYVAGSAADVWVEKDGPFSPTRATEILLQAASALHAAHDAAVIHRDVKPGNLLITKDGAAKLGDFGMAMSVVTEPRAETARAGTPYYTAPEIWRGQSASPATDIYALGATYFHLLTGRPPLEATNLDQLIAAHLQSPVPDARQFIPDIPLACTRLVQRCMEKLPKDRFASAQALSWEARGVLRELSRRSPVSTLPPKRESLGSPRPDTETPFFGFTSQPFVASAAVDAPSRGEPFRTVRSQLRSALLGSMVQSVLFFGEQGSGKTTLAQQIMAEYARQGSVVRVSDDDPSQSLPQQLLRTFGVIAASAAAPNGAIDLLLTQLEQLHAPDAPAALLVLDDVLPSAARVAELATLVQAGAQTRAFRLLVVASPELCERMPSAAGNGADAGFCTINMPALNPEQTLHYMQDCLLAASGPATRRVIVTPDAALLVAYRSSGNLSRINRIGTQMLNAAAREKRRLISSWDAWRVSSEAQNGSLTPRPMPADWPTAEVLEILNSQRRAAGIPSRRTPSESTIDETPTHKYRPGP